MSKAAGDQAAAAAAPDPPDGERAHTLKQALPPARHASNPDGGVERDLLSASGRPRRHAQSLPVTSYDESALSHSAYTARRVKSPPSIQLPDSLGPSQVLCHLYRRVNHPAEDRLIGGFTLYAERNFAPFDVAVGTEAHHR